MRTTAPRPYRRVCTIATATLLTVGMGVFGSSAAFAASDTDLGVTPSTAATDVAAPSGDPTPTSDASPSSDASPTSDPTPTSDPSPTSDAAPTSAPDAAPVPSDGPGVHAAAATTAGQVSINGTAGVGETLTNTLDLWPAGTTFTYQWLRGATPILGATAASYTLVQADVGSTVSVQVVGTAPGDDPSAPVTSDPTAVVGIAPSYGDDAVQVDLVAGESYSHFFDAGGTPTPRYQVFRAEPNVEPDLPEGLTFANGTVSGIPTQAGSFEFQIAADSTAGQDQIEVDMTVAAAPAAALELVVAHQSGDETDHLWDVATNGTTTYHAADADADPSTPITAKQGDSLDVFAVTVDRFENYVDSPVATATSSVGSDTIGNIDGGSAVVRFNHASPHTITVTAGGFTNAFTVQVDPITGAVSTIAAPAATRGSGSTLAYTGSDDSGLLVWALGLLIAGAAVTVLRFRRRRTQR